MRAKPKAPAHIAKLIKKKKGYSNYYFNELHRDRLWKSFTDSGDFSKVRGEWVLKGKVGAAGKLEVKLSDDAASGRFPGSVDKLDLDKDLAEQLAPNGSGGLLATLHLWRRMLTLGPKQFGEVFYLGSAPVVDRDGLFDVLVATHDVVEARFYFDPQSGLLAFMEMFSDPDLDPCEVYFDDYQESGGRKKPGKLTIRFGDSEYGEIQLEDIAVSELAKKDNE